MLEKLDLAQGALGKNLLAKDIGDLFDSDAFIALVVYGGTAQNKTVSLLMLVGWPVQGGA